MLFAALLLGTFVFLWQKTRPVKVVYTIVQPKLDTLKQFVVATGKVEPRDEVLITLRTRTDTYRLLLSARSGRPASA